MNAPAMPTSITVPMMFLGSTPVVVLLAGGVEQLVDDVLEVLRQCFRTLAREYLTPPNAPDRPVCTVSPGTTHRLPAGLPHLLQLFRRVVDQCAETAALTFRHGAVEDIIHLFPDDAGAVIENMLKRLRLAVQIAHEMLGALGEVTERVEADQRGACRRDAGYFASRRRILICSAVRCGAFSMGVPSFLSFSI